jgi:hypothetical protein
MDPRAHWQKVYETKKPTEVSWYQPAARVSSSLIRRVAPDRSAAIIDVGGGASTLVDGLLAAGYSSVSVLDVSSAALAQASERLGGDAARVTWLEANVLDAALPASAYDVWHDRAVFHFLTEAVDRGTLREAGASVGETGWLRHGGYVRIRRPHEVQRPGSGAVCPGRAPR